MNGLRPWVFWPPFLLILSALGFSFYDSEGFVALLESVNGAILGTFSMWFASGALFICLLCVLVFLSPLGSVRLGGKDAKPLLKPLSWCAITLCTSTAVGILLWAMSEPIIHFGAPPPSLGFAPKSPEAARFALSTLFLHWSFTPCALYALPALMFAFAFYNMKLPFSLASPLVPLVGRRWAARLADPVDAVALYALVAGMAASLGTGILTLAGGVEHQWDLASGPFSWVLIGTAIVLAFITSAISGLQKGVRILSNLNTVCFFILAALVFTFGPTSKILALGGQGYGEYVQTFFSRSLFLDLAPDSPWPRAWTVFYWAIWFAWAPVTAVFLGRIGVGYTVRTFLTVTMGVPAVFALMWMLIFGGAAIALEQQGAGLSAIVSDRGPEAVIYSVLGGFPLAGVFIPLFLGTAFIAYVTAADSNTMAMAGMSSRGISPESPEPAMSIKLLWGCVIGGLAMVMLCLSGLEGVKTLSYLGGLPALFYQLAVAVCVLLVCFRPKRYDKCA